MTKYLSTINELARRCPAWFARLSEWARFIMPKVGRMAQAQSAIFFRWLLRGLRHHPIAIGTGALTLFLLYQIVTPRTIVIQPLSVPKELRDNGYTADVAATHLRDALNNTVSIANTRMKSPALGLRDDLPDFVVPTVGVSIESLAALIRTFFRIERRQNISGEFIIAGDTLSLRLRRNGVVIHNSKKGVTLDHLDQLIQEAVTDVVDATEPYLNAVIKSHNEPTIAVKMAQRIIANRAETDPNVRWAHLLIGAIRYRQERFDDAVREFEEAIKLNHRFADAHSNLGLALFEQGQIEEAVEHFRTAIGYNADLPYAHNGLATALTALGSIQEAKCERQRAIAAWQRAAKSNPRDAVSHHELGEMVEGRSIAIEIKCEVFDSIVNAWNYFVGSARADVDPDDAISEYREAIKLDPEDATAYKDLGLALVSNKSEPDETHAKSDEAIKAFRHALMAGAEAHANLADELYARGIVNESDEILRQGIAFYESRIKLDSNDFDSIKNVGNLLLSLGEINNAINEFKSFMPSYFIALSDRGYAEFDAGLFDEANEHLTRAVSLRPRESYDVLWLHLTRRHMHQSMPFSELQVIKTILEDESEVNQWPLPIIRLFMELGGNPEEILSRVKGNRDRECEANFYIGEWYLLRELHQKATPAFQQAVNNCRRSFIEFSGAKAELSRILGSADKRR